MCIECPNHGIHFWIILSRSRQTLEAMETGVVRANKQVKVALVWPGPKLAHMWK